VGFTLEMARAIAGVSLNKGTRVIDPACGAGAFLLSGLDKGIGSPATIFGIDIDAKVRDEWELNGLAEDLGRNLYIQNGLYDPDDNRVSEKLPLRQFDLVVGNPPYGGFGVREVEKDKRLFNSLRTYELWRLGTRANDDQDSLFAVDVLERLRRLTPKEVERLERFPVEVLFLERFVRLAKAGGVIAIVIPDGILANVKFDYVRGWVAERCHVVAVVSLPRGTFRGTGTTAKTSILFLRKKGAKARGPKHVFMAQLDEGKDGGPPDKEEFDFVLKNFREKFKGYASGSPIIWTSTTTDDLWDNRWDAYYWDPTFTGPIKALESKFGKIVSLGDTNPFMTYGAIITGRRPKMKTEGVLLINPPNFFKTGFDMTAKNFIGKKSDWNKENSKLKKEDVLIVRSGVGCVGRAEVFDLETEANVGCYVDIFRQSIINPYYLALYLKSKYGLLQFERLRSGVGTLNVNFAEIKSIKIPLIPDEVLKMVEKRYKSILRRHYKFTMAKRENALRLIEKGSPENEAEKTALADRGYWIGMGRLENELTKLLISLEDYLEGKSDTV